MTDIERLVIKNEIERQVHKAKWEISNLAIMTPEKPNVIDQARRALEAVIAATTLRDLLDNLDQGETTHA
jgi:hypothetical protein